MRTPLHYRSRNVEDRSLLLCYPLTAHDWEASQLAEDGAHLLLYAPLGSPVYAVEDGKLRASQDLRSFLIVAPTRVWWYQNVLVTPEGERVLRTDSLLSQLRMASPEYVEGGALVGHSGEGPVQISYRPSITFR